MCTNSLDQATPQLEVTIKDFCSCQTRVDVYKNSFFPFTIKLWNQLDDHIIQAPSLDLFNNYINL